MIFCEQVQYQEWLTLLNDIQAGLELLEFGSDEELEWELIANFNFLSQELKHVEILNLLYQPFDDKGAFITITAGSNDTESQTWIGMLLSMYSQWCNSHQCKIRLVDESWTEWAGFNYIILEIIGEYAYGYLKSEQGIHQLRRISPFDENSSIQTSFADVEVIPIIDESIDFEIPEEDLQILGGRFTQMRGQSPLAKVIHIPTGISVTSTDKRSQLQNKEKALTVVRSKLFALIQAQGVPLKDVKKPFARTTPYHPIRKYIFHPDPKVEDLCTQVETVEIEEVMKGKLDLFIKAYLKQNIAQIKA